MNASEQIAEFLAPHQRFAGVDLCLPRLARGRDSPLQLAVTQEDPFTFPSFALAERDARSAMHVVRLIANAVDLSKELAFPTPEDFSKQSRARRIAVVFGSRSNHALPWVEEKARLEDLVRFEFGAEWAIIGQDGRRFAMRDPSTLNREDYTASTDYGVVARTTSPGGGSVFLLAGLGSRATEGAGLYLFENWRELQAQFADRDFAVVLKFKPPVDPKKSASVAHYSRSQ